MEAQQTEPRGAPVFRFGAFELDIAAMKLYHAGVRLHVQEMPLRVLQVLLERPGELVSHEEFYARLWPDDELGVLEDNLYTAIRKLRHVLEDSPRRPRFIETVPRKGYRFVAPVVPVAEAGELPESPAARPRSPGRKVGIYLLVLLVMAAGGAGLYYMTGSAPEATPDARAATEPASVAVLPFVNMSGDPEQEYFSDGLTEELTTRLSQVAELRVLARTSSFAYKGKDMDVREIGRALGVAAVVEGSVRAEGDRIRVTAQLIDVETGFHHWADTYDRRLTEVFAIQQDLAYRITEALERQLSPSEKHRIEQQPTENLEAYSLALRGRYMMDRRSEFGIRQGIEYFREALELDPDFARAHAWLADAQIMLGVWGFVEAPSEIMELAHDRARRALELDASLAEAWASLGFIEFWHEWDWEAAERSFLQAIELNPGYATAHHWYSLLLSDTGRFAEAEERIRRARALDPLSLIIHTISGRLYYFMGRHEEAVAEHLKALELDPTYPVGHMWLALAYEAQGRIEQALEHYQRAVDFDPESPVLRAGLAHGLAIAGETDGTRAILRELQTGFEGRYVPPFWIAVVHASLGETSPALDALEQGLAERDGWMTWLKAGTLMESVRSSERFESILKRMGFT